MFEKLQTHPGGIALRFARVKRYPDESAAEADTIDVVRAILERERDGAHPRAARRRRAMSPVHPTSTPAIAICLAAMLAHAPVTTAAQDLDPTERARLESSARALEGSATATPPDVSALCELGWTWFRLGDARARATLDRAIVAAGEPTSTADRRRLGACLYSRGRALESVGDRDAARVDYRRSIALRPNATVSERLASLGEGSPERDEVASSARVDAVETFDPPRDASETLPPELLALVPSGETGVYARATLASGALRDAWLVDAGEVWVRTDSAPRRLEWTWEAPADPTWGAMSATVAIARGPGGVPMLVVHVDLVGERRVSGEIETIYQRQQCFAWDRGGGEISRRCVVESQRVEDGDEWSVRVEVADGVITRTAATGRPPRAALRTVRLGAR